MSSFQRTLALVKPHWCSATAPYARLSHEQACTLALGFVRRSGLQLGRVRRRQLSREQAEQLYQSHRGKFFYPRLISYISSGTVTAIELEGDSAITRWREQLGPTRRNEALAVPDCARAQYGFSDTRNAMHGSDEDGANDEIDFFFSDEATKLDESVRSEFLKIITQAKSK
eukprot:TRINITY_DN1420_c0_g1_i1.p2 TRINITY_DN1420_c0_g1~~TRINITY_DN1420_c0_g1_i1.p2  ORF type:complete len:171 (-),score=33.83 TRINITY_DN1420_c0_g1_i1:30-542(-)